MVGKTQDVSVSEALDPEFIAEREAELAAEAEAEVAEKARIAALVIAPEVAPRNPVIESGWDHKVRTMEAWEAIPGFAEFLGRLTSDVRTSIIAFVADGNAVPGFQPAGVSYQTVEYEVEAEDGTWVTRTGRKRVERKAKAKTSYVLIASMLAAQLKAAK